MNYKFNIIDDKSLECKIVEFSNANFKERDGGPEW